MEKKKLDYSAAGVDIAAADRAKEKIKELARKTFNPCVLSEIGAFGGFFKPDLTGYKNPVLISSADGVGTKLKIAFMTGRHNTVGEDLVNHCVNDILVHGARPLFFLDYIATGKLEPEVVADIVTGLSRGCQSAGMALLGGETAEMPDFYPAGEYDLAGFIVGIVEQDKIINGSEIEKGDILIGLASEGLHTNGYSLARKAIFETARKSPSEMVPSLGMSVADALLATHRSYKRPIFHLMEKYHLKGMAHITGGGIKGNLIRILPDGLRAVISKAAWEVPPIFSFIQQCGNIADDDMYPAFNMGIGYIIVVAAEDAAAVINDLRTLGESPYILGEMEKGEREVILKA